MQLKVFVLVGSVVSVSATPSFRQTAAELTNSTSVPPHWPYASVEDFFTNSGTEKGDMDFAAMRCAASGANEKVHDITDGKQDRCFVSVTPSSDADTIAQDGPYPVLFFAHGSGGNAGNCGNRPDEAGKSWVQVAKENKFVFVCGEALQYSATNSENPGGPPLQGGLWEIPEVFNNSTGQNCDDKDSFDNVYIDNVIAELNKEPDVYDTSRFFVTGCSMGSAFTVWQGPCLHSKAPNNVSAFSTHSTGLKIKGDGLRFPPDTYNSQYEWGECPTCEYWPTVVDKVDGLKACIFDNTADPSDQHPDFYTSSQHLATYWANAGNRAAETHYGSGGHCVQHSFEAIATCLDDGTGRLVPGGSKPSPTPSPSVSPSPHGPPHPPSPHVAPSPHGPPHPPSPHVAPSPGGGGDCDTVVHNECPGLTGPACMQCTAQYSNATHAACKTIQDLEKACDITPKPGPQRPGPPGPSVSPSPHGPPHPPSPHVAPSPGGGGDCDTVVHNECPGLTGPACMQCTAQYSNATHAACKTIQDLEKACDITPRPGPQRPGPPGPSVSPSP